MCAARPGAGSKDSDTDHIVVWHRSVRIRDA
jgi:hypothetical protein